MPLIRCTKKLLAEMGAAVSSAADQTGAGSLGDWYANLLRIDRKKCVIFTSKRTLLTFLAVDLGRDVIRQLAAVFRVGLSTLLADEGFGGDVVDQLLSEYQDLALAPTADRSVLGSLNVEAQEEALQGGPG